MSGQRPTRASSVPWLRGAYLPAEWGVSKVKYLVAEMRAGEGITAEEIEETGPFPVYGGNGLRGFTESKTHTGTRILIGRQGALCGNVHLVDGEFWASEHAIVAEPSAEVDPRWLAHLLRVMNLGQYSQTAAQPGIGTAQINALDIPIPSLPEQRAIADYLDRETAKIDTLIEEQQRLVEMLRERRVATISEGLADATRSMSRLKHLAVVQTGITLSGEGDPSWPEWPYLRVANVQVGYVDLAEVKCLRLPRAAAEASLLRPGDVLMTEGGDIDKLGRGAMWQGEIPMAVHQNHVFAVRPGSRLSPKFLIFWLDGPTARNYFRSTARKTTNLAGTSKWTLGNLPVPCPPVDEQRRIAAHLDEQTSKIDALIAESERFVELSRERRSALITAAVTGQIDVRGEVA